jgi:HEAT repeat protein
MPTLAIRLLALALAALSTLAPAGQDDAIVSEFKKYFKKYKDTPTRVEAVLSLEGSESPAAVEALVSVLPAAEPDVVEAAVRVLGGFRSPEPGAAVVAALEQGSNDKVREVLLRAVAQGGYPVPEEQLRGLLADPAWTVRRRALEATCRLAPPGAVELVAGFAADAEPAVRAAALEGLAALGAQAGVAPAIAALEDPVWQVRASAVAALGKVRSRDAVGPLIARMQSEEGRLVADIGEALASITGRDFGTRAELWQSFWEAQGEHFVIPTDAELARLRSEQAQRRKTYEGEGTSYHGVDTPSRAIVFVIDVSGSMEALVVEKERFEGGGYPSFLRIDIVKTELARTLETLEPWVEFNILAFATEVQPWKKALVKANVVNKSSAIDWVNRLVAIGGASQEDLAHAGLVGAANLEAGKTNSYGALMAALGAPRPGEKDDDYAVAVDTIFFLSDGRPSHGEYIEPKDILREVRRVNDLRRVVIHTIAIGEFQKDFMRDLAAANGGVFVDLGR